VSWSLELYGTKKGVARAVTASGAAPALKAAILEEVARVPEPDPKGYGPNGLALHATSGDSGTQSWRSFRLERIELHLDHEGGSS
jgi:hypothetical protein